MNTFVDEIKKEIATVQTESESMLGKVSVDTDAFLDAILEAQHDIKEITRLSDGLYNLMFDYFNRLSKSDIELVNDDLLFTLDNLDKLYIRFLRSNFYSGIKTDLKVMRHSIDNVKEINNDLKVFKVQLPADQQYKSIIEQLNTL